eukprot:TRINITY_DN4424_c0_g1_i1.p1 TRINITY_DN4424_c0_g1~~TRINITY_DN4424_c0_g1_i1.p1  ORF type:complete len:1079 (-),score=230.16 TRINITY_DN4424_c0_g1_i1:536-3385(-)
MAEDTYEEKGEGAHEALEEGEKEAEGEKGKKMEEVDREGVLEEDWMRVKDQLINFLGDLEQWRTLKGNPELFQKFKDVVLKVKEVEGLSGISLLQQTLENNEELSYSLIEAQPFEVLQVLACVVSLKARIHHPSRRSLLDLIRSKGPWSKPRENSGKHRSMNGDLLGLSLERAAERFAEADSEIWAPLALRTPVETNQLDTTASHSDDPKSSKGTGQSKVREATKSPARRTSSALAPSAIVTTNSPMAQITGIEEAGLEDDEENQDEDEEIDEFIKKRIIASLKTQELDKEIGELTEESRDNIEIVRAYLLDVSLWWRLNIRMENYSRLTATLRAVREMQPEVIEDLRQVIATNSGITMATVTNSKMAMLRVLAYILTPLRNIEKKRRDFLVEHIVHAGLPTHSRSAPPPGALPLPSLIDRSSSPSKASPTGRAFDTLQGSPREPITGTRGVSPSCKAEGDKDTCGKEGGAVVLSDEKSIRNAKRKSHRHEGASQEAGPSGDELAANGKETSVTPDKPLGKKTNSYMEIDTDSVETVEIGGQKSSGEAKLNREVKKSDIGNNGMDSESKSVEGANGNQRALVFVEDDDGGDHQSLKGGSLGERGGPAVEGKTREESANGEKMQVEVKGGRLQDKEVEISAPGENKSQSDAENEGVELRDKGVDEDQAGEGGGMGGGKGANDGEGADNEKADDRAGLPQEERGGRNDSEAVGFEGGRDGDGVLQSDTETPPPSFNPLTSRNARRAKKRVAESPKQSQPKSRLLRDVDQACTSNQEKGGEGEMEIEKDTEDGGEKEEDGFERHENAKTTPTHNLAEIQRLGRVALSRHEAPLLVLRKDESEAKEVASQLRSKLARLKQETEKTQSQLSEARTQLAVVARKANGAARKLEEMKKGVQEKVQECSAALQRHIEMNKRLLEMPIDVDEKREAALGEAWESLQEYKRIRQELEMF